MINPFSDYHKYDKLSVIIYNDVAEDILPCYKALGWKLYARKWGKLYRKTKLYEFYREHKIKNKDKLQLLQVYMEDTVNILAHKAKKEHTKSVTLSVVSSLLSLGLIGGGIAVALAIPKLVILGIVMGVLGVSAFVGSAFLVKSIYKKEELKFAKIKKESVGALNKIYNLATALTEVEDGQI